MRFFLDVSIILGESPRLDILNTPRLFIGTVGWSVFTAFPSLSPTGSALRTNEISPGHARSHIHSILAIGRAVLQAAHSCPFGSFSGTLTGQHVIYKYS